MEIEATVEDVRRVQVDFEIKKACIISDVIDFHNNHSMGFYSFEPYVTDFTNGLLKVCNKYRCPAITLRAIDHNGENLCSNYVDGYTGKRGYYIIVDENNKYKVPTHFKVESRYGGINLSVFPDIVVNNSIEILYSR
jgi:hypothetical protein